MDHFAVPPGVSHVRVPNLTKNEYTSGAGGFLGYPPRCKWTEDNLKGMKGFGHEGQGHVQAFFQTWLYFGFAIEFLAVYDVEASMADFLDEDDKFVSTAKLPSKIRRARRNYEKAKEKNRTAKAERSAREGTKLLEELSRLLKYYLNAPDPAGCQTAWPVSVSVSMSMIALGHTLGESLPSTNQEWPVSSLLRERILKAGWCPMDYQRCMVDMPIDGHYYVAMLPKPLGALEHTQCTGHACVAGSVDEKTYVTRHSDECCSNSVDEHIAVENKRVVECLDQDEGYPVVSWVAGDNRLDVKQAVVGGKEPLRYVAISHVWADGMGNPRSNALPRCQLVRLQRLVNNLAPRIGSPEQPVPFWMDTLCVPVAADLEDYRKLSIRRMKDIYKSAAAVLVVESGLMRLVSDSSEYDISLSIYFSSWNRRLWTFQEGMMANKLMIQFADRAMDYRESLSFHDEGKKSTKQGHCITFPNHACAKSMGEFVILHDFINRGLFSEIYMALAPALSMIQHRTTSRLSDQTLCACTIMGRDPVNLLNAGVGPNGEKLEGEELEEARMIEFYKMLGKVPIDMIFNICPRMKRHGFRWAPSTFLGIPKNGFLRTVEGEAGVLTKDNGLTFNHPGFIFPVPLSEQDMMQTDSTFIVNRGGDGPLRVRLRPHPQGQPVSSDTKAHKLSYAVIMYKEFGKIDAPQSSTLPVAWSEDAVVGVVEGIKTGENNSVQHIRLRHEFLARLVVVSAEADNAKEKVECEFLHKRTKWFLL